ncbi:hypothetical protein MMC28_011420 [Mycoblastus sanguinarius]|nr:hypothetical protein [Mycoblastus sanguinarius]
MEEVHVSIDLTDAAGASDQESLLFCLRDIRGCGQADITGSNSPSEAVGVAKLMTTSPVHVDEVLARTTAYRSLACQEIRRDRIFEVRSILYDAVEYLQGWLSPGPYKPLFRLGGFTQESLAELMRKKKDMIFAISCFSTELGDPDDACRVIDHLFKTWPGNQEDDSRTPDFPDAHYHLGISYVVEGLKNAAAYSFLQALSLSPGHDVMEARLQRSADPEDILARFNVEHTLRPYRHMASDQQPVQQLNNSWFFDDFVGSTRGNLGLQQSSRLSDETDKTVPHPF